MVITPGYDTTRILEPLRPDGSVDYAAALEERARVGANFENNAAPQLLRALEALPETVRGPVYDGVGLQKQLRMSTPYMDLHAYLQRLERKGQPVPRRLLDREEAWSACKGPWRSMEFPEMAAFLRYNESSLQLIEKAVVRSHFSMPLHFQGKTDFLGEVGLLSMPTSLHLTVASRAMLRLGERDVEGCLRDLRLLRAYGRFVHGKLLLQSNGGIAAESMAYEVANIVAASGMLDEAQARLLLSEWETLGPYRADLPAIDVLARWVALDVVRILARDGGAGFQGAVEGTNLAVLLRPHLERVRWDQVCRAINVAFDEVVQAAGESDYARRSVWLKALEMEDSRRKEAHWHADFALTPIPDETPEAFALRAAELILAYYFHGRWHIVPAMRSVENTWAGQRICSVALALAAYQARDAGQAYPRRLEALTPDYLAEVPMDYFTGKPLLYRRRRHGYLLKSVRTGMKEERQRIEARGLEAGTFSRDSRWRRVKRALKRRLRPPRLETNGCVTTPYPILEPATDGSAHEGAATDAAR